MSYSVDWSPDWSARPTVRLVEDILGDTESRSIYQEIIARRWRRGIDPDYVDFEKRYEASNTAVTITVFTEQYIRFAARLVERISLFVERLHVGSGPDTSRAIFDATISNIWEPLPDSETSDFRWLETTYAAVMSNRLVQTVERVCLSVAGSHFNEELFPEMSLVESIVPLLGLWTYDITRAFDSYYLQEPDETATAIETIGTRLGEYLTEKGTLEWPALELDAPSPLPTLDRHLFEITFKGDPVVNAQDRWLKAKSPDTHQKKPQTPEDSNSMPPSNTDIDWTRPVRGWWRRGLLRLLGRWTVWYATDRVPTSPHAEQAFYGSKGPLSPAPRPIHYGRCTLEAPLGNRPLSARTDDMWTAESEDREEFYEDIKASLDGLSKADRQVLVFIHGFNTPFAAAVKHTAQLVSDLRFPGVATCFSWPSINRFDGYVRDHQQSQVSAPNGAQFLHGLLSLTEASAVHVVAHSMGNILLGYTLEQMELTWGHGFTFNQLILAAPDVDIDLFCTTFAVHYPNFSRRTSLYTSDRDEALRLAASSFLGDGPRAGLNPPRTIVDRVDTVDVSRVTGFRLIMDRGFPPMIGDSLSSWIGHQYYADSPEVIVDMRSLVRENTPRNRVAKLASPPYPPGTSYWELQRRRR